MFIFLDLILFNTNIIIQTHYSSLRFLNRTSTPRTCPADKNQHHQHQHSAPAASTMAVTLDCTNFNTTIFSSSFTSLSSTDFSQHFGGRESLSCSDLDHVQARSIPVNGTCLYSQDVDVVKVRQDEDIKVLFHDDNDFDAEFHSLDSARSSFSSALKECQDRRSRSEALTKKIERHSAAPVPATDVVSSSPLQTIMKKNTVLLRKSGNFPSPGTPSYRGVGVNKGWSSERVALPSNGSNRRVSGAALLPLNNNVRTLPSKWEDAERWICSPIDVETCVKASSSHGQSLKRPKSKSGPLGAPGVAYYSMYSPVVPMYDGGGLNYHMVGSPFSTMAMMADNLSFQARSRGSGRDFNDIVEPCIARSVSVHGCTDLGCQTHESRAGSLDEKTDEVKDAATNVSCEVSRRDMATQMSPEGSHHSSPRRSSFSPSTRSILPVVEVQSVGSSKSEVRDVQIDERVTVTRWSKKYMGRITGKGSGDVDEWKKMRGTEPRSSTWEVADTLKSISKASREEARITAWENLQKAKAEAEIRKLEMKLEKKRSSSIEKIMKKLKSAQKKAGEMRSAVLANQAIQVSTANNKSVSFRRTRQMGSLSACFTCHAL